MEIIGVVKDIKYTNLRDEIPVQMFVPYLASRYVGDMTVYVRTSLDPDSGLRRGAIARCAQLDANLPLYAHAHHGRADRELAADRTADRESVDGLRVSGHAAGHDRACTA